MAFVSSSPTQTSFIDCAGCGEKAPSSRRFCGQCGQLLWEPCLACGEINPVNERFCGKCGTDINADVQAAQQVLSEAIATADSQAETGRFLDAVATLEKLTIADHSQLRELADEIRQRIERFPQQREEVIQSRRKVTEEARQLLDDSRSQQAYRKLSTIPQAFRDQEIKALLEDVESCISESKLIRDQVKEALRKRQYENLLPQVERLAELDPQDQQVQGLLARLRQRHNKKNQQDTVKLLALAKAALAKCDYTQAQAALQKLPANASLEEDTAKVVQAVKERVWLADQLRTQPFVSPTLRQVGARLVKLQPHDKRRSEILKQLESRWQKAMQEKDPNPVPWAKSAEKSSLGVPITPLPLPKELVVAPQVSRPVAQGLLLAFGLALQGLGKTNVAIDLSPKGKESTWLNGLTNRDKKQSVQRSWGVDIGTKYLKAVQLVENEQNEQISVLQSIVMPIGSKNDDSGNGGELLTDALQRLAGKYPLDGEVVVVNIPGTQTFHRFFDIPAAKPKKFFEAVEYEMRARIPLEADQLLFDYHWSDLPTSESESVPQRRVVLAAANRNDVERRFEALKKNGASNVVVQGDCIALYNAVQHVRQASSAYDAFGLVEIGAETSNFIASAGSTFWCRGLFQGTNAFDREVSAKMDKTLGEAELLRCKPEKLAAMHELDEHLQPQFASFAAELERTLNRFQNETGQSVSRLFLCGLGSEQFGLLRYLHSGE